MKKPVLITFLNDSSGSITLQFLIILLLKEHTPLRRSSVYNIKGTTTFFGVVFAELGKTLSIRKIPGDAYAKAVIRTTITDAVSTAGEFSSEIQSIGIRFPKELEDICMIHKESLIEYLQERLTQTEHSLEKFVFFFEQPKEYVFRQQKIVSTIPAHN